MINHKAFPFLGYALRLARAFGYLYDYEVLALQTIVRTLPESATIVNFGAGAGTSALAIVEARPDLVLNMWTIDISPGGPLGGLENERNAFRDVGMTAPNQMLGDSAQAGCTWHFNPVDFIFIDGDHLDNGVRSDIEAWLPHMTPGGIMAFHDYDSVNWSDVKKNVDHMLVAHQEIMLVCTTKFIRINKEN